MADLRPASTPRSVAARGRSTQRPRRAGRARPFRPRLAAAALLAAVLAAAADAGAACKISAAFPIHQCADRAWFAPPPEGAGAAGALFWQIGFGNASLNSGEGGSGVGIDPSGRFTGNDGGLAPVGLLPARRFLDDPRVPEGSLCLAPLNWANDGVDGCCDNVRDPEMPGPDDGLLNPRFDTRLYRKEGRVEPTLARVQDYPLGVLLRDDSGRFFAVAAVASAERGGGPEDFRVGAFSLADVVDGDPNPLTGARNVVPWQRAPVPRLAVEGPVAAPGGAAAALWRVEATWDRVRLVSDQSRRPSEAYGIDNPGHGVGVADMGPLVRYRVETAHILEGLTDEAGYPIPEILLWESAGETEENRAALEINGDTCVRIAVHFGLRPRSASVSVDNCALGRCGDVGYRVAGPPVCLEGEVLRRAGRLSGGR